MIRFIKFSAVGWIGVSVQLSVLSLLKGVLGVHYLLSTVVAVESAILHNFLWHERWTWRDRGLLRGGVRLRRVLRFNLTSGLVSILGNVVFMRLFVGELGLHYLVANLASIAACALLNFVVNDRLVFMAPSEAVPACASKWPLRQ